MKNKTTLINVVSTLLLQVVTFLSGFIVPKLILSTFGSETNGLVLSLNQFLNYIALIEGGINGVVIASLYGPLVKKDNEKISSIIKTSNNFLRKIGAVLIIYSVLLAVVFPFITRSSFSWPFIFTLTLIMSIKLFIQYCFSFTFRNLLSADKRVYLVSLVQTVLLLLEMGSAILVVKLFPSVHILKLASALVFVLQPLLYGGFVKKHYDLDKKAPVDKKLMANRWDGLAINTAAFIHNNTDIAIISIFRSLQEASVYGVYALVTSGLKTISQSLWKALGPSIGKIQASGDKKELNEKFDTFEFITLFLVFFVFSVAGLLITPFVGIYTSGVSDGDYFQPVFGILLVMAEAMYVIREPYVNLAYSANKFKDLRACAIMEAILNIIISLSLVSSLGLIGIAIGTLVAMSYRTIYQVWYLKGHLINRPFKIFIKNLTIFTIPTIILEMICARFFTDNSGTILGWLLHATVYCILFGIVYILISLIFFRPQVKELKNYLRRK